MLTLKWLLAEAQGIGPHLSLQTGSHLRQPSTLRACQAIRLCLKHVHWRT